MLYRLFFYFIEKQLYNEMLNALGERRSRQLVRDVRRVYRAEIPRMPYIGGSRNFLTFYLVGGVWVYALFLALKEAGIEDKKAGEVLYNVTTRSINKIPRFVRWRVTRYILEGRYARLSRALDEYTAKREFPGDWVLKFVDGKDKDFVFGIDYVECALCKYFNEKGMGDYARYICVFDIAFYEGLPGIRFTRTQTLAEGNHVCDYRFCRDSSKT